MVIYAVVDRRIYLSVGLLSYMKRNTWLTERIRCVK